MKGNSYYGILFGLFEYMDAWIVLELKCAKEVAFNEDYRVAIREINDRS